MTVDILVSVRRQRISRYDIKYAIYIYVYIYIYTLVFYEDLHVHAF